MYKKEYEVVDADIKAIMYGRDRVLAGQFLVERKVIHKQDYVVRARDETRLIIRRI